LKGKHLFYHGRPLPQESGLKVGPRRASRALYVGFVAVLAACGGERAQGRPSAPAGTAASRPPGEYSWQPGTWSPQPADPPSADLGAACDKGDAALVRVAQRVAERELGRRPLDVTELAFALRVEGAPYVWPELYTLVGPSAGASGSERLAAWLGKVGGTGERRCGVVRSAGAKGGHEVVAAVAVSVLADLEPLPTRARIGQWLRVRARLLVPASEASVHVLGPRGSPRRVPTSLADGIVDARFAADQEGDWLVQVVAHVAGGPRPVAEAALSAGSEPPAHFAERPAPGEEAEPSADPNARLLAMVNAGRRIEKLLALRRDETLDAMALAHANAMRDAGRLAHDVGDGTPLDRATKAGISPRKLAENLAHAVDVAHAYRSLWASISHRTNLLGPAFDSLGVGTASDTDGTIWVALVFADLA
jgi:uncharacterized protein YkwD